MRLYNRSQGRIYTKKRESVSLVERRKRRSKGVHPGADEEGVYKTVEITTDSTGILCGEEGWKEEDGAGLSISK